MYCSHLISSNSEPRPPKPSYPRVLNTNTRAEHGAGNPYELYQSTLPAAHLATFCGCRRSNVYLSIYVFLYMGFMVTSSIIFMTLERPVENQMRMDMIKFKNKFLDENPCLKDSSNLDDFIVNVIQAYQNGIVLHGNMSTEPNWSFGQALFFTATVVTTIGYGHVTPISTAGKVFCILLALMGIPLTLMLLTALVERLMIPTTKFLNYLIDRQGQLHRQLEVRFFHLCVIGTIVVVFFYLIPAGIFTVLEDEWGFLDSLYYCIISLTTVGLGDFVPGDKHVQPFRLVYKICTTGYLIVSLTTMMWLLTVYYDIPQLNFGRYFLLKTDEETRDPERMPIQSSNLHLDESESDSGVSISVPRYMPLDEPIPENIIIQPFTNEMLYPQLREG